jgi:hypothetical protein
MRGRSKEPRIEVFDSRSSRNRKLSSSRLLKNSNFV